MDVGLAIIRYRPEHDRAVRAFQQVESQNAYVKVIPLAGEIDPKNKFAGDLLRMIE